VVQAGAGLRAASDYDEAEGDVRVAGAATCYRQRA